MSDTPEPPPMPAAEPPPPPVAVPPPAPVAETTPAPRRRFGCLHVILFVLAAVMLTVLVGFLVVRAYLFPSPFRPVTLNDRDEKTLETKLERLDFTAGHPDRYKENDAARAIRFDQKELNALIAQNTDLADKLAIDLSRDLVSARLLIPLDQDFPVLGGKTLRVSAGVELRFADGRPVVILKGISVMGVPLPNAWLGGMKNIDLIEATGSKPGFWKAFADGVESIQVEDGRLTVKLKE